MLKAYKNKKNKILNQYDKILKLPNILSEDISLEQIEEKKKQLEEEHFFVSFTGQINAGKSTVINALLFGEEIIPTNDTPHTAKITIIKYGDKPRLEATFYNKEEWKALESNQEFYKEFLEPDIEKSLNKGLYIDEIINTKAKIKQENGLENLTEYVARDGKYTPFVNLVTLYYPADILKEITIVDTPGTNDPNELRDKVAKEWINKTNANIYIAYAGQAMDKVDIDFIDNFLLSVPKEQKLTVINKIDSVNDTDGLEEYISELLADERLRRREVVSNRESLVLVSGLGALIDKMLTKELDLNEDLTFYAEQFVEKGFLEPENHKLSTLEKMIEKKLIENKGKNILESHSKFLGSVFEKRIIELTKKINEEKSNLNYLLLDSEKLDKSLDNIEASRTEIMSALEKISNNFSNKLPSIFENKESKFINIKQKNITFSETEIKKIKNSSNYKKEVSWIVKEAVDTNYDELKELISEIREELVSYIKNEISNFKTKILKNNSNFNDLSYTISIYTQDLSEEIKNEVDVEFTTEKLNNKVKDNQKWYQCIDTKTKMGQIVSGLMKEIKLFFEQNTKDLKKTTYMTLDSYIKSEVFEGMREEIEKILTAKEKQIEKFLKDKKDKDELINQSQNKKEAFENELSLIETYKKEVM